MRCGTDDAWREANDAFGVVLTIIPHARPSYSCQSIFFWRLPYAPRNYDLSMAIYLLSLVTRMFCACRTPEHHPSWSIPLIFETGEARQACGVPCFPTLHSTAAQATETRPDKRSQATPRHKSHFPASPLDMLPTTSCLY